MPLGSEIGAVPFKINVTRTVQSRFGGALTKANLENIALSRTHEGGPYPEGTMVSALAVLTDIDRLKFGLKNGFMTFVDDQVLTPPELEVIAERVDALNAEIAAQVAERDNVILVDINAKLNQIKAEGLMIGGTALDTSRNGGLFSWDGIHPTKTGYAIFASEFLGALRARLTESKFGGFAKGTAVANVDLAKVLSGDPQRPDVD